MELTIPKLAVESAAFKATLEHLPANAACLCEAALLACIHVFATDDYSRGLVESQE